MNLKKKSFNDQCKDNQKCIITFEQDGFIGITTCDPVKFAEVP